MSRSLPRALLLICCILLFLSPGNAQLVSYEDQVNLYHPTATGETGLFTTIVGETLRQGEWSFSIYWNNYDYLTAPPLPSMVIPSARGPMDMDIDETRYTLSLGYGLTDRWEIVASVPYIVLDQNSGDLSGFVNGYPMSGSFSESGLGNVRIGTKIGLIDPDTSDSRLALGFFVGLPTGDEDSGIASGNSDWGAGLHWNRGIWSAAAQYVATGDRDADDNPLGFDVDVSNEIRLDLGTNVPLRFWETTNWINEINAILYRGDDDVIGSPDDIVYLVTGLRHWFGTSGWALNAGVRVNLPMLLDDDTSGCAIGGLLGLSFAPMHLTPPPPPPPVAPPPPPPPPVTPPPPPPVTPPREPVELRVDEILFESGSPRVTNIAKAILDDVALRMKQEPTSTAIVIGYNEPAEDAGLDRRRAESVRDYLVSRHGIDPSRITLESRGTADAASNDNNRRVVIRLIVP